tara:strand:- start:15678 stop:16223 length:546 start_codon:yes stop_codon:yes gene_type:complete
MEKNLITKLNDLTKIINKTKWFSNIGKDFNNDENHLILKYTNFFDKNLKIRKIKNWEEAIKLLNSNSWSKEFWNKEEDERIKLDNLITKKYSNKILSKYLGKFTNDISNIIGKSNFKKLHIKDEKYDYYSRVAIGSAASCCHQVALAIIANQENHFFTMKFELFQFGFWPLIISNNEFNIF